jgi:hypothetical protein
MEIDESIVLLGEELDAWWEEFSPMLDSEDRGAQAKTLLRGFEIAKRFDSFKTQGLAAVKALLDRQDTTEQAERSGAPFQQLSTNILACM